MASGECTNSGMRVWVYWTSLLTCILLIEMTSLSQILAQHPEQLTNAVLTGAVWTLATAGGVGLMQQGLANADFNMAMRITLVSLGGVLSAGAVLEALRWGAGIR